MAPPSSLPLKQWMPMMAGPWIPALWATARSRAGVSEPRTLVLRYHAVALASIDAFAAALAAGSVELYAASSSGVGISSALGTTSPDVKTLWLTADLTRSGPWV